jgi:hypothetical protein
MRCSDAAATAAMAAPLGTVAGAVAAADLGDDAIADAET